MPAKRGLTLGWLFVGLWLSGNFSTFAQAQDDRYANWRSQRSEAPRETDEIAEPVRSAEIQVPQEVHPLDQFQPPVDAAPLDAAPQSQETWPQQRLPRQQVVRQLPVRFQEIPANAAGDRYRSKVVLASATEPLKITPEGQAPRAITKPRKEVSLTQRAADDQLSSMRRMKTELPSPVALAGSLGVVVGLFLIVAWVMRRGMPKQAPLLPREAMEVLGRQRLTPKQEVHLVRLGNKLVLLSLTPGAIEALAEITEPAEVDRMTGLCYQAHPNSSTNNFRQMFDQMAQELPTSHRTSSSARKSNDKLDLSIFDNITRSPASGRLDSHV